MEMRPNAFSLRGESGLVKIVSDSVFTPSGDSALYSDAAQCDIIVESNGFRVNKTILLEMPRVAAFLRDLSAAIERGSGEASLGKEGDELSLVFSSSGGGHSVSCAMNDRREGKENSVRVKYPIEPSYYAELKEEFSRAQP